MNPIQAIKTAPVILIFAAVALNGCSTSSQVFEGHSADAVWTAMIAVAKTPDYSNPQYTKRWVVRENNVWVNEDEHRIEIERRLERYLYRPQAQPEHETREWKYAVTLEENDPPKVEFASHKLGILSKGWDEADRFFAEVWDVLNGAAPAEGSKDSQSISTPREAPKPTIKTETKPPPNPDLKPGQTPPPVDIDKLDPAKP